jgi:hypothetical protein
MNKSYATLTQLKSFMSNSVTGNDADLLRILEDASQEIDDICMRYFNTHEDTEIFDGAGTTLIPSIDILSISAINLDMDGSGNYATSVPLNTVLLYPLSGPQRYPKTELKFTLNSGIGYWASGIRAGVQITGVFGYGDGKGSTTYYDSGITGTVATTSGTSLTLSSEDTIQAGHTLRIGSEQMYVQAVSNNGDMTATVVRGQHGTTAAIHTTAEIYIYSYPGPIVEATILQANRDWKRKESPVQAVVGSNELGIVPVTKGIDPDVMKKLQRYIRRQLI